MMGNAIRRAGIWGIGIAGGLSAVAAAGIGAYAWNNTTFAARRAGRIHRAGYRERIHVLDDGTRLNYAEGPANGPPLVLLHGQATAWQSYHRVLPALARDFHVYAIDQPGHGLSDAAPGHYTVHALGQDVIDFVNDVVGEAVFLSGHSSGGLIAAWVAAEAPALVLGTLFEDPPFFSTEPERLPQHFYYVDLAAPAHEFLAQAARQKPDSEREDDFTSFYMAHNAWLRYFGKGREGIVGHVREYRRRHPGKPLTLWYMPPSVGESYAHMHRFDPRFAEAFHRGEWQRGFDQAAVLAAVAQPSILVHARWRSTPEGILEGAMTDDDAARACALMPHCRLVRVRTGHGFHAEDPRRFIALARELRQWEASSRP